MSELKIITNNRPRDLLYWWDLTDKERAQFDYYTEDDGATFFRYRGEVYDLGEFMRWNNPASPTRAAWDGFRSDSFFSGLAVRFVENNERVVVARCYS
jgi:hypothetical protein